MINAETEPRTPAWLESESALGASEDAAAKIRAEAAQTAGTKITGVERYEAVAEAQADK